MDNPINIDNSKTEEEQVLQISEIAERSRIEAREACLNILSNDRTKNQVRLLLAKLYFQDEYYEFSLRELILVKRDKNNDTIERLIKLICDNSGLKEKDYTSSSPDAESERILAEIEI
ncbi:MAG: hypothetical protein KBC84_00465 [Proteobacteria bacterium]|nr:hypothetical protein [Pseudomonadota bacterium]